MATRRDQIITAAISALSVSPPSGVPAARRRRFQAIEASSLPIIDVLPAKEVVKPLGGRAGPIVQRHLEFIVRIWTSGEAPEVEADPIVAHVTARLAGNLLGGLVTDMEEISTEWAGRAMDSTYGATEVRFLAQYQTKTNNQEVTA